MREQAADPFDAVAPFYDLDLEGYEDDVALYLELAERHGSPILELGCGTGRVVAALAAAGVEAVGVDISPAMLAVARARVAGVAVELLEADMRTVRLDRRFPLVLVPLGGLQHLETADDLVAALETVAHHLTPGGVAIVDVEAPHPDDLAPGPQPLLEHWTRAWGSGQVTKTVAVEGRPALGLRDVSWHFDVQPAEGPLHRVTQQFTLRTWTATELELAARLAGLELTGLHGDYDLAPYDDGAIRLIACFEAGASRS